MVNKQESEAWKQKLIDDAEQEILNLTDSDKFKEYLTTLSKFSHYSQRNINMIHSQNPDATLIAGFKKWQSDFNRTVNKGEKSMRILAPMIKKLTPEEQIKHNTTADSKIVGYRYVPVFDISQTSGDPVLTAHDFVSENLKDTTNVERLYSEFKDYLNNNTDLEVSEQPLAALDNAKGYFRPSTNQIVIGGDEPSSVLKLKTLYHEYAHSQLHGLNAEFADRPRAFKETQAEAVGYVAMKNLGIDTEEYSLGYVATWAQDKEVIKNAIAEIHEVSSKTIDISNELVEKLDLNLENEQVQNKDQNLSDDLESVAEEHLIVKANSALEAVQKLYNNELESAIQDTFTLSDNLSEEEKQTYLTTADWEDVVDIERSNNALNYLGNGLYSDEYLVPDLDNPYQENTNILNQNVNRQVEAAPESDIKIADYATGTIDGQSIDITDIDYFSENPFEGFDLKQASDIEIKALAYNLLAQSKDTVDQIATMNESDEELAYWQNDYDNEKESYTIIADELQSRGIKVPNKLDYFDNRDTFEQLKSNIANEVNNKSNTLTQITSETAQNKPSKPVLNQTAKSTADVNKRIQDEMKRIASENEIKPTIQRSQSSEQSL